LDSSVIYNFAKRDCRRCFSTKPIRKREPVQNPKLHYFKPFEFFDHSVLQKHTDKEFIMN